ncbi:hypothetical protein J8J17_21655, partial [Mycobacterium tuberculosis]|nr:hypothetical protein [Mycobacterium tuberculosis]
AAAAAGGGAVAAAAGAVCAVRPPDLSGAASASGSVSTTIGIDPVWIRTEPSDDSGPATSAAPRIWASRGGRGSGEEVISWSGRRGIVSRKHDPSP